MGGENGTVFSDPVINKGFRVLGLVSGNELEGLTDKGEAKASRREAEFAKGGGAEEEEGEERERSGEEEREEENIDGILHNLFTCRERKCLLMR